MCEPRPSMPGTEETQMHLFALSENSNRSVRNQSCLVHEKCQNSFQFFSDKLFHYSKWSTDTFLLLSLNISEPVISKLKLSFPKFVYVESSECLCLAPKFYLSKSETKRSLLCLSFSPPLTNKFRPDHFLPPINYVFLTSSSLSLSHLEPVTKLSR